MTVLASYFVCFFIQRYTKTLKLGLWVVPSELFAATAAIIWHHSFVIAQLFGRLR